MTNNNEELVPLFIPSLVATLWKKQLDTGRDLTEDEVISIRNNCNVVMSPPDAAREVAKRRGYEDINPENVWAEWKVARDELKNNSSSER